MKNLLLSTPLLLSSALLSGCDLLGVESVSDIRTRQHAEAVAVGGACRQAGTSLQDCMDQNEDSTRAGLLEGWRSMDGYIREHPDVEQVGARPTALPLEGPSRESRSEDLAGPVQVQAPVASQDAPASPAPAAREQDLSGVKTAVTLEELVASGGSTAQAKDEGAFSGSPRVPWQLREIASKREFERRGSNPHGVTRWFGAPSPAH